MLLKITKFIPVMIIILMMGNFFLKIRMSGSPVFLKNTDNFVGMVEGFVKNINSKNEITQISYESILNNTVIIHSNMIKEFIDNFEEKYKLDEEW
jgi:hypothetical protein